MVGLILVLSALSLDVKWEIAETGVYRPFVLREVAVTDGGDVLIVHRKEAKVLKYDSDGALVTTIGQRGQGPGEFALPTWIHYQNGKFYVEDENQNRVSSFEESGKFIESITLPESNYVIEKVQGGWIYGDWDTSDDTSRPVKLVLVDDHFKNPRVIATWQRPTENSSASVQSQDGKIPAIPINPAVDESLLTVSPDGKFAFFIRNGSSNLEIVDIAAEKIVGVRENDLKPVPFNENWGQKRLDSLIEQVTGGAEGLPIKFVPNFPSHFPTVRNLETKPNGDVVIVLWTGLPDKNQKVLVYGPDHQPKKPKFTSETLSRWLADRGEWSYVTYFDAEEEEGRIACVKTAELDNFAAKHPVIFDGLSGNAVINID